MSGSGEGVQVAAEHRSQLVFGGAAELLRGETAEGWRWTAVGADGASGVAAAGHPTREEAAAHAGAFLAGHA
ncbi:hypothetical protein ABZW30_02495 [Kitasatospora sp. NPDC004669]|uniref:hypothetical protein n=1 Tax=Kitasatospora sp. NPDC004669 TaxID=3154555 RepID=UPI0033AA3881